MNYRSVSNKCFALTDLEDGQLGINLDHLEELEHAIVMYLDLLGLDCTVMLEIQERDKKNIPLA